MVGKEFNVREIDGLFAATPPLDGAQDATELASDHSWIRSVGQATKAHSCHANSLSRTQSRDQDDNFLRSWPTLFLNAWASLSSAEIFSSIAVTEFSTSTWAMSWSAFDISIA